ncbi:MAG: hypothetical protein HXS44_00790 [Theionarchaea archaeon]|nr:hypothetical protein [Theionarchaea archaeon]
MKKGIIVIVVMLISLFPSVSAESPFKIIATVPPFVRPGDENVTIQVTVTLESGEYEDVELELILHRFFSPSQEGSDTFKLGDMSTTDIMKPPLGVAIFQVDVSPDATYGDYSIQVYIKTKSGGFMDSFTVHVVGQTLVEITSVSTSQDPIEPGTDFQLDIQVKNIGSNALKWIKVALNPNPQASADVSGQLTGQMTGQLTQLSTQTATQQTSSAIIPISSDLERIFKDISPRESITASYLLSVEVSAESRNHAMAVTLVYQDETGMVITESRTIGIKIKGTPDLELQGIEADPAVPYHGEEVILSVTLENNGTAEAKSVKVVTASSLGNYTSFIGTMKRNENNAAVFKILMPEAEQKFPENLINNLLNRTETHTYSVMIQVFYYDADGNQKGFAETWDLAARTKQDKTIFYVLGGLVAVIIIVIWRLQSRRHLKALEE